ncbi:MAG TPA: glycerophosphodiester phosphodiesterase [Solirubrobacteraceae bacterium]|nr:glycerophosphodiester phosphodiesterase [Solirubrobacteraceae bacterium]
MWRRHEQQQPSGSGILVAHRAGAALTGGDPIAGLEKLAPTDVAMIEFDVRATADRALVISHDSVADGHVLAESRYEELVRRGSPPPLLEDLLGMANGRFSLDVELKESGYEREVVEAVLRRVPKERVVFTSFQDSVIASIAGLGLDVGTGLIVGRFAGARTPLVVLQDALPLGRLRRCGADFLVAHRRLLSTGLLRRARAHGYGVAVWGVEAAPEVERLLAEPGVLGVITDSPTLLRGVQLLLD